MHDVAPDCAAGSHPSAPPCSHGNGCGVFLWPLALPTANYLPLSTSRQRGVAGLDFEGDEERVGSVQERYMKESDLGELLQPGEKGGPRQFGGPGRAEDSTSEEDEEEGEEV